MNTNPPTFDEWYEAKRGQSFESMWMKNGQMIEAAMRELSRAMREYTTEMVRKTLMRPVQEIAMPEYKPTIAEALGDFHRRHVAGQKAADRQGFEPPEAGERN